MVDSILDITKNNDYSNCSEQKAKVKTLENQINQLVYNLYDLTLEEIKIIDGEQITK